MRNIILGIGFAAAIAFILPAANRLEGSGTLLAGEALRDTLLFTGVALLLSVPLLLLIAGRMPIVLSWSELIFSAWLFGALAFLNTWDLPIYWTILVLAVWWGLRRESWRGQVKLSIFSGISILALGIVFYLPWYPTFTSQAGGILPNLVFPTKFVHLLIMFGPLMVPIAFWVAIRAASGWKKADLRILLGSAVGIPLGLFLVSVLLAAIFGWALSSDPFWLDELLRQVGAADLQEALRVVGARRSTRSLTALFLALLVGTIVLLIHRKVAADRDEVELHGESGTNPWPFVALLVGTGGLLILGPEFFYLRDLFGTRMNTVFKFYYAAWMLWGIAAAYAAVEIWPTRWNFRSIVRLTAYVPLLLGLMYPVLATWTKTEGFDPQSGRSLDGTQFLARTRPEDFAAVQWINENLEPGVIAEAVGGSYSEFGRISTHTGFPTVLGWDFHEIQWRGSAEAQGSRRDDIARLYQSRDWDDAREIMRRYGIEYVYIGPLERSTYTRLVEGKFEDEMKLVYRNPSVAVYALTGGVGKE